MKAEAASSEPPVEPTRLEAGEDALSWMVSDAVATVVLGLFRFHHRAGEPAEKAIRFALQRGQHYAAKRWRQSASGVTSKANSPICQALAADRAETALSLLVFKACVALSHLRSQDLDEVQRGRDLLSSALAEAKAAVQ